MLRILLLALVAAATAFPSPKDFIDVVENAANDAAHAMPFHTLDAPCTGTGDPSPNVPYCYVRLFGLDPSGPP